MEKVTRPELNNKECGKRLRECRKECGLTQAQLADKINELEEKNQIFPERKKECFHSDKQISYLENGSRPISPNYARLLSRVLGVRYEWLMGEDDHKTAEDYDTAVTERKQKEKQMQEEERKQKEERRTAQRNAMYENVAREINAMFENRCKTAQVGKLLDIFDIEFTINHEGLEDLSCYKRITEGEEIEDIHTFDFIGKTECMGDSQANSEYRAFIDEKEKSGKTYIFFHKKHGEKRYMGEEEKNQLVDEICNYMDYIQYKIFRQLKKEPNSDNYLLQNPT